MTTLAVAIEILALFMAYECSPSVNVRMTMSIPFYGFFRLLTSLKVLFPANKEKLFYREVWGSSRFLKFICFLPIIIDVSWVKFRFLDFSRIYASTQLRDPYLSTPVVLLESGGQ